MQRLGINLVFLGLFSLLNGHWGAVQSVAWVQMVKDRAPGYESLARLVVDTLSATAPCELCSVVDRASQESQDDASLGAGGSTLLVLNCEPVPVIVLNPPPPLLTLVDCADCALVRPGLVLKQPPRVVA